MPSQTRAFAVALLITTFPCDSSQAQANIQGMFSSGQATPYKRQGVSDAAIRQQTEEALQALTRLTFLSENDAHQYARNVQSLTGYYAYVKEDKTVVLLGESEPAKVQRIDLKDDVIFRGVVKNGYNAGIGIPILKVDLKADEVAELTIQDVVTVASRFGADEIACNFPFAWRETANPKGAIQYYYIPAATISVMNTRRFNSSNQSISGIFSIVSIGANKYYSDEAVSAKYFVTVTLIPVSPLEDAEQCKLVAEKAKARGEGRFLEADFGRAEETEGDVAEDLKTRANEEVLQGATLTVRVETYPKIGD